MTIFSWLIFLIFCAIFYVAFRFLLKMTDTVISLRALAQSEFYEKTDSILQTPADIPDEILTFIKMMNQTIGDRQGPKILLNAIKTGRHTNTITKSNKASFVAVEVEKMRPELQELFKSAVVAWLNCLMNRNLFYQQVIGNEMRRGAVSKKQYTTSETESGLSVLSTLGTTTC